MLLNRPSLPLPNILIFVEKASNVEILPFDKALNAFRVMA